MWSDAMLKGRRKADNAVGKPPRRLCQGCDSEPCGTNDSLGSQGCLCDLGQQTRLLPCDHGCFALLIRPPEQGRGRHRTDPHCPTPHLPLSPLTPSLRLHPELKLLSPTWGNNLWCRLARMRPAGLVPSLEAFPGAWNELGEGPRLPAWTCTWTVLAYGTFCACVKRVSAVFRPYWFFFFCKWHFL